MVIKILPLLCAQAGPESQVAFDGPVLCRRWSLLPTESVKLSIDQAFLCLLAVIFTPHTFVNGQVECQKILGQELGMKLNCPQLDLQYCHLWSSAQGSGPSIRRKGTGKGHKMFEDMEWWLHPHLPVVE